MPKVLIEVRGKSSTWGVAWFASQEQIDAMREDGLEIGVIENTVPGWVADFGLAVPWCFFQDIWNLKNPFRRDW